ncbi:hypothetical protein Tco_0573952 [Tanacetum coccineum]
MQNSPAYQTYLAFATGAVTPKKIRKFKKPASPSKKKTLVTTKELVRKPAKKPKPAKKDIPSNKPSRKQSTGVQIKDTPGGSSEGAESELEVLDEPKCKSIDTSEGTGSKLGVPNSDDEQTKTDNPKTSDDEEETQDDESVHTPEDYVPTHDETNDESKNVDDEEYERINEELYGDVNISLTDAEPTDEEKGDMEITNTETADVELENVNKKGTGKQVKDGAQATQNTEVPLLSSSISSAYAAEYLNFDNIPPVDTQVVSMLDINVQHEVPRTSPLLSILVSVIPEHKVINPPITVTTASATTISSLLSSLFPHLQQLTPIPTPTTTEATTSTTVVTDFETLTALHQRITDLEKEVLKKHDADIIKEHSVLAEIIERLSQNMSLRKALKISEKSRWSMQESNKSPKQRALYHALMESILKDEDAMDEGVTDKLKKRKPYDADKDEGPFAGSDLGLKGRKSSKDTKPSKKAKSMESSKGTSKSQPKFIVKSTQTEEIVFEAGNTQEPHNQGQYMGNTDDQPIVEAAPKHDWFKKPERPPTLDSDWNVRKSVDFRPHQTWISKIAQAEKTPLSFDELMSTPIDFSAYVMNNLKIDNLTQEHLVRLVFNLLKGTCKSHVELEYYNEECYKAVIDRLD